MNAVACLRQLRRKPPIRRQRKFAIRRCRRILAAARFFPQGAAFRYFGGNFVGVAIIPYFEIGKLKFSKPRIRIADCPARNNFNAAMNLLIAEFAKFRLAHNHRHIAFGGAAEFINRHLMILLKLIRQNIIISIAEANQRIFFFSVINFAQAAAGSLQDKNFSSLFCAAERPPSNSCNPILPCRRRPAAQPDTDCAARPNYENPPARFSEASIFLRPLHSPCSRREFLRPRTCADA